MNEQLSFTNSHVQQLRRLIGRRSARVAEGRFVIEGPTLIADAVEAGLTIDAEFVAPAAPAITAARVYELADGVIERVASTTTPQPNIAIAQRPAHATTLADVSLAVVADRIADPGNLGTILRSAEAAGVDAVVVTPGTVDAFSPKVVRASAGAVFFVPVLEAELADVAAAGLRLVGTSSHEGTNFETFDWSPRSAIVLGNEAHGLDPDAPVDAWVRIEHAGRSESLNVAMAATLLVFAAARGR